MACLTAQLLIEAWRLILEAPVSENRSFSVDFCCVDDNRASDFYWNMLSLPFYIIFHLNILHPSHPAMRNSNFSSAGGDNGQLLRALAIPS